MRRRDFIKGIAGSAAALPLAASAQQLTMPVIGFISPASPEMFVMSALNQGLNEAGFIDGKNVTVEYHWAAGHADRLAILAADLVSRKVSVIVTGGGPNVPLAAKAATTTTPIIFVTATDPIDSGLVTSISQSDRGLHVRHALELKAAGITA